MFYTYTELTSLYWVQRGKDDTTFTYFFKEMTVAVEKRFQDENISSIFSFSIFFYIFVLSKIL